MTPRERRLASDLAQMSEQARSGRFSFQSAGHPPERYSVMFHGRGLAAAGTDRLAVRDTHRADLYLHLDYPRRPPIVTWLTPVFHPNLLGPDRNGGVCIGSWSAAESLADLCLRLHELVTYAALNPADPLDRDAAAWAVAMDVRPGADVDRLAELGRTQPVVSSPGAAA